MRTFRRRLERHPSVVKPTAPLDRAARAVSHPLNGWADEAASAADDSEDRTP